MSATSQASGKIRVGLLLDALDIPAWQFDAIECLRGTGCVDICVVIHGEERLTAPNIYGAGMAWPYTLVALIERRFFSAARDPFKVIDSRPVLECALQRKLEASAHHDPQVDVYLQFGLGAADVADLRKAPYGVWRFNLLDTVEGLAPLGLEAVYRPLAMLKLVLSMQRANGVEVPLHEAVMAADPVSLNRTWMNLYGKASLAMARKLKVLRRFGIAALGEPATAPSAAIETARQQLPSAPRFAVWFVRHIARYVWHRFMFEIREEQWGLLWRRREISARPCECPCEYRTWMPPRDCFWADPDTICENGEDWVFFEECPYATDRGHISAATISSDGKPSNPAVVLREPFHLSYPILYRIDGVIYMLPETSADRTVRLYRCDSFPHVWSLDSLLMRDIEAVDSTLLQHSGKWWLFATVAERPGMSTWDELHIFFSDRLKDGVWTPHPLNPVVSDVRTARPAGRLFRSGDDLMRPSQDCSNGYGYALSFNRVLSLSETEYSEECIGRMEPSSALLAVHTYNSGSELEVSDMRRHLWRWRGRKAR